MREIICQIQEDPDAVELMFVWSVECGHQDVTNLLGH